MHDVRCCSRAFIECDRAATRYFRSRFCGTRPLGLPTLFGVMAARHDFVVDIDLEEFFNRIDIQMGLVRQRRTCSTQPESALGPWLVGWRARLHRRFNFDRYIINSHLAVVICYFIDEVIGAA